MKLLIQHGKEEFEYTAKDLKREAERIVSSAGFKEAGAVLIDHAVVITGEGRARLKVTMKKRVPGSVPHQFSEPTTEYVAL